jgi:hypothetical protein
MRVLRARALACLLAAGLLMAGVAGSSITTARAIAKGPVQFYKAEKAARALSSDVVPLGMPAGYKIVKAGPFNSPSDTQTLGKVTCPGY